MGKGESPMKRSFIISISCIAVLAILVAGCISSPQDGTVPPVSLVVTPSPPAPSATCGFTSCHGLNLACGLNPPQFCTADYQLGDKCRQFAYCNSTPDACMLVTTAQFESCKSCIDKCAGADPAEIFSCEEKC